MRSKPGDNSKQRKNMPRKYYLTFDSEEESRAASENLAAFGALEQESQSLRLANTELTSEVEALREDCTKATNSLTELNVESDRKDHEIASLQERAFALEGENAVLVEQVNEQAARLAGIEHLVEGEETLPPSNQHDSGEAPVNDDKTRQLKVRAVMERDKVSEAKAWPIAAKENPELFWNYSVNPAVKNA